jgi:hypothetical protein
MKNKHLRITLALALVAASLAAVGSLAGPVSTASAAASIDHLNYLDFPHRGSQVPICSVARRMRLRGTYTFRAYSAHRLHPQQVFANTRILRLHGVYAWQVCLLRNYDGPYVVWAQVRNMATGGKAQIKHAQWGGVWGDGYYDWGTQIDNVRG